MIFNCGLFKNTIWGLNLVENHSGVLVLVHWNLDPSLVYSHSSFCKMQILKVTLDGLDLLMVNMYANKLSKSRNFL